MPGLVFLVFTAWRTARPQAKAVRSPAAGIRDGLSARNNQPRWTTCWPVATTRSQPRRRAAHRRHEARRSCHQSPAGKAARHWQQTDLRQRCSSGRRHHLQSCQGAPLHHNHRGRRVHQMKRRDRLAARQGVIALECGTSGNERAAEPSSKHNRISKTQPPKPSPARCCIEIRYQREMTWYKLNTLEVSSLGPTLPMARPRATTSPKTLQSAEPVRTKPSARQNQRNELAEKARHRQGYQPRQ